MSRPASRAYQHYKRALALWPRANLRPELQFPDVVGKRIQAAFAPGAPPVDEKRELAQANAMFALLEDRFSKKHRLRGALLEPRSRPTYYREVLREIEDAPKRSWLGRMWLRITGTVRLE